MVKFNRRAASTSLNGLTMNNAVDLGIDNKSDLSNCDKSDDQNNECRGIYGWGLSHAYLDRGMHYANYDGSICKGELDEDSRRSAIQQRPRFVRTKIGSATQHRTRFCLTQTGSATQHRTRFCWTQTGSAHQRTLIRTAAKQRRLNLTSPPCHWPSLSKCPHYEIHHYQQLKIMFLICLFCTAGSWRQSYFKGQKIVVRTYVKHVRF